MKTQSIKQLYTLILTLLVSVTAFGQSQKVSGINEFLTTLDKHNKFMGVVAIYENGEQQYIKASGYADVQNGKKLNTDTRFRIGSISKMFTAVLTFQTIEKGLLSLDTPLSDYYPEISNSEKITISDMLEHRSGIPNFTNTGEYIAKMESGLSESEVLKIIKEMKVEIQPKTQTSYSNSNYYLLSKILEKTTQKTFDQLLTQGITAPLKLKNTFYGSEIDPTRNEAYSYKFSVSNNKWAKASETNMGIPLGAGAIVSTTADLSAFINALFTGKLISDKNLEQMKEIKDGLGKGMMVFPFYSQMAFGHNGSIDGFESSLAYFPDSKTTVVMLANALSDYSFNNIALGVLSNWFGKPFDAPNFSEKPINRTAEELKAFSGTYSNSQIQMNIKVWEENGSLMAQADGQSAFNLDSYENDTFKFIPAGITMKFDLDQKRFTLLQGGGEFVFVKK